ncbi:sigma-70 family RNA polymerase sigma factor [Oxobacter pfennigii]|uniref:sigma-70 family RNA polymerase sigma factor n=1 Tax=Oxobacter pfennigii TaxID=36849 RepID=UPI001FA76975|nr:sigma-70 family RNA polymerase sigma factor [Oxobacter pfennigii]
MKTKISTCRSKEKGGGPLKITEDNFIVQMKKRNEKALEYVIDNYAWILKTVIKKHLFYLPDLYEECINDCLLAIWNNIYLYVPERNSFKNWIGGIAKYKSIDYLRKHLRDLENENIDDVTISVEDNSLKSVLTRELEEETEKVLNSLSQETREIFKQLYFEGKDIDELAEATGFSKSVLYNRISRGKKKIRKEMRGGH